MTCNNSANMSRRIAAILWVEIAVNIWFFSQISEMFLFQATGIESAFGQ